MPLYAVTLFISASLMFLVEMMFAKMVLPLLGGTPAVWITCMIFFQAALLAGYAYAHWTTSVLKARTQIIAHLAVILPAIALLPISIPRGWIPPQEGNPVPWLLTLMLVSVGLPFLIISTSSPLLQRWFALTRHPAAGDPYFLYAASNAGSLFGLIGYLVIFEPNFTVGEQSRIIGWGYILLVALTYACACTAWKAVTGVRTSPSEAGASETPATEGSSIPIARMLKWLGLAFVPSSLMLGVTTYLTTDIAAVPLLWAIPLALYLLTFMLAFARRSYVPYGALLRLFPMLVLVQTVVLQKMALPMPWQPMFHIVTFFVVAMVCHRQLASDRPPVRHLTEFYLILATGGALGSVFNGLIAPVIFKSIAEYPLVLLLGCLLCLPRRERGRRDIPTGARAPGFVYRDILEPVELGCLTVAVIYIARQSGLDELPRTIPAILGVMGVLAFTLSDRPTRFTLGLAAILIAMPMNLGTHERTILSERNFFGVLRVTEDSQSRFHNLIHGSTLHGMQFESPRMRCQPLAYYCRSGPIGDAFSEFNKLPGDKTVAIIGLGAGSLAAYARKGQTFTFYEINPAVARVAKDPHYFTYLRDGRERGANMRLVLGDGRMTISEAPDGTYDMIVLDAFSSDSIPVHLLTREALSLYLRKLDKRGWMLINISNQYLDLQPLVAELAADANVAALVADDTRTSHINATLGRLGSMWVLMARNKEDFGRIASFPLWRPVWRKHGVRVWTDDYSNILDVLVWSSAD